MITIIFNGGYAIGSSLDCKETMPLAYHLCKFSACEAWVLCRTRQNRGCEWMLVRCHAHEWYQRDWQYCGNTNVNTNSMRTKTLKSIERTTCNKIPLSGLQRRARHALAHDALLQMGSDSTYGAVSSKKKNIQDIDVDLFAPVSESIGCKRHPACLGCAGSLRILAFKVLQKAAQPTWSWSNKLQL